MSDDDTLEEILIESEEDGVNLIANTLYDLGYSPVIQDGTWEVGIGSGDDYVHLVPDIRFTDYNPGFSYFEFNSQEDPGVGYSDDLPFYQEIDPGYESQIVEQVQYLLDN